MLSLKNNGVIPAFAGIDDNLVRLSLHQQALDASVICFVHDHSISQVAFLLLGLCGCDVAQACAVALDFPGASYLESLLGAGMGLHLRHKKLCF